MDLALDLETHDIVLTNGDLYFVNELDAIAQYLRQKAKLFLGEWFLDESRGIPYFDSIFVKNPNIVEIDNIFKVMILETPGVVELLEFDIVLDTVTRRMTLTFKARAEEGEIIFNEEISF